LTNKKAKSNLNYLSNSRKKKNGSSNPNRLIICQLLLHHPHDKQDLVDVVLYQRLGDDLRYLVYLLKGGQQHFGLKDIQEKIESLGFQKIVYKLDDFDV